MIHEQEQTVEKSTTSNGVVSSLPTKSLYLSASPHVRNPESVKHIMGWVIIALVPSMIASGIFFGLSALFLTAISICAAIITEWLLCRLQKKESSVNDMSAIVTGILVAFNVSSNLPWWMVALGSIFAIGVAKMPFGGLGFNFINPALAGRAFLMACYPAAMTSFVPTRFGIVTPVDGITSSTPLAYVKNGIADSTFQVLDLQEALKELFIGNVGGCLGETSAIALLIGGVILIYKRIIPLRIPFLFIGTVFLLSWLFNGTNSFFTTSAIIVPFYQILAGGLFLGAFFMATDMVTTPITPNGKILFAIGCGTLTFLIRKFGGYPEGVSYSILIMNLFVPLIERYTRPRIYGEVKNRD